MIKIHCEQEDGTHREEWFVLSKIISVVIHDKTGTQETPCVQVSLRVEDQKPYTVIKTFTPDHLPKAHPTLDFPSEGLSEASSEFLDAISEPLPMVDNPITTHRHLIGMAHELALEISHQIDAERQRINALDARSKRITHKIDI